MQNAAVHLNGVDYRLPKRPVVVVCIDGGDPAYFDRGRRDGIIPNTDSFIRKGFGAVADGTMPSFTCPNNMSIVTGAEPDVHGISGNFYLDPNTGEAVVMTGPELLRSETILGLFSHQNAKVVSIAAKDKLRRQLSKNMKLDGGSICFSSECADQATTKENGIANVLDFVGAPLPHMYSQELSLFVLDAGIKLLEKDPTISLMYLSLTDYVQHKYAPGEGEANRYYRAIDERFGKLQSLGRIVALTADHGMNDKSKQDGTPNVIWLQDILDSEFGKGSTTVVCPIADRFVAHHGALGGFVRVYSHGKAKAADIARLAQQLPGVEIVVDKKAAAARFELPLDREGDVVVIGNSNTCLGASAAAHDLSGLEGHRLRTHGALTEAKVPFVISEPINGAYADRAGKGRLRSHNIFDFAMNGTASAS